MDDVLGFIYDYRRIFYMLGIIIILLKVFARFFYRDYNFIAVITSFFKIYREDEKSTAATEYRRRYMVFSNYINYTFYVFALLVAIIITISKARKGV